MFATVFFALNAIIGLPCQCNDADYFFKNKVKYILMRIFNSHYGFQKNQQVSCTCTFSASRIEYTQKCVLLYNQRGGDEFKQTKKKSIN